MNPSLLWHNTATYTQTLPIGIRDYLGDKRVHVSARSVFLEIRFAELLGLRNIIQDLSLPSPKSRGTISRNSCEDQGI